MYPATLVCILVNLVHLLISQIIHLKRNYYSKTYKLTEKCYNKKNNQLS